ncbi:MAG: hypothetical protein GXP45_06575 [bacterium]|nr:hypothetical protein [bacterium]
MFSKYKYIIFEGIHGSGKSFIPKQLSTKRQSENKKVEVFHFPNEKELLGKAIREVLTDPKVFEHREVTGLLYAAHANRFHYQHDQDDSVYLFERHSVTS